MAISLRLSPIEGSKNKQLIATRRVDWKMGLKAGTYPTRTSVRQVTPKELSNYDKLGSEVADALTCFTGLFSDIHRPSVIEAFRYLNILESLMPGNEHRMKVKLEEISIRTLSPEQFAKLDATLKATKRQRTQNASEPVESVPQINLENSVQLFIANSGIKYKSFSVQDNGNGTALVLIETSQGTYLTSVIPIDRLT
jgi:hypothetical protein